MIELQGNWFRGFAFDLHTTESVFRGVDPAGKDKFDTKYTEMGELIHRLKYRSDRTAISGVIRLLSKITWRTEFDFIIPIPPTDANRSFQPVTEIAAALGEHRNISVLTDVLVKTTGSKPLKTIADPDEREQALRDTMMVCTTPILEGASILLVDDLYRSGATLRIATELLMQVAKAGVVCVLTMTRTRSHR